MEGRGIDVLPLGMGSFDDKGEDEVNILILVLFFDLHVCLF